MTKKLFLFVLLISVGFFAWAEDNLKDSIVKIYAVYNSPDYYEPWQMWGQNQRNGSGCIISGNRILTSAHIVSDNTFIQVRRASQSKRYIAQVEIVAHECDLAVLKVDDLRFFADANPLDIGDLPRVRDKVSVYGFPVGGEEISITEGVVSRIENFKYTHSSAYLLTCQIDAAINPGNSGGPVIKDGKIVGVAFQAGFGENIGYMVPSPVVTHFLSDIEDGHYDGIPGLGINFQRLDNESLREKFSVSEDQTGILVTKVLLNSPGENILKKDDIVLSIDGTKIENDGSIEFRPGDRTSFLYLTQKKFIGDKCDLEVLRQGEKQNMQVTLNLPVNSWYLVPSQEYDVLPTYYVIGGLVFEPLTVNFLKSWGQDWYLKAPINLMYHYNYGEKEQDRQEVVILVRVLADEVSAGYHEGWENMVVDTVNSVKISTIDDLVKAFEENKEKFHEIDFQEGYKIVLDKDKVEASHQRILDRYKIRSDRSENLKFEDKPQD